MSQRQAIYTSCMRGIHGVNDGQQIFSCDADFERTAGEDVKRLFAYQTPALDVGVVMTDALVGTMPQSFAYRMTDNGLCAVALNTYLGRDYMGAAGRFGNYLSHVIVVDRDDMTAYPCEYYASPALRTSMAFEEVNNPNPPDYLPAPELVPGERVSVEAVGDFLGVEGRMDVYKKMLRAMLSYEQERKRLVICDEPENVILWIAALEYALPREIALDLSFTTYAFDPTLSPARICGVLSSGTRFTPDTEQNHLTFHLLADRVPELDADGDFYDFIDTAMSFSYQSAQEFHQFLLNGYRYRKADLELCDAYALYSLLSDGFENASSEKLRSALDFANRYASPDELRRVMLSLMNRYDELTRLERGLFLAIAEFFAAHAQERPEEIEERFRELFVDAALSAFLDPNVGERSFTDFFNDIERYATRNGFSLSVELMGQREKLFDAMKRDVSGWKIAFIVHVVSTYVMEARLKADAPEVDAIYAGLIGSVFGRSGKDGVQLVHRILDEFSKDPSYLVHMALRLDEMLKRLPGQSGAVEEMWGRFGQLELSKGPDYLDAACQTLSASGAYQKRAFALMEQEFDACQQPADAWKALERQRRLFKDNARYEAQYGVAALERYYAALGRYPSQETYAYKRRLFEEVIWPNKDDCPITFGAALVRDLTPGSLSEPKTDEQFNFIKSLFEYGRLILKAPVPQYLLLLYIGVILCKKQEADRLKKIERITRNQPARLPDNSAEMKAYFDWTLRRAAEVFKIRINEEYQHDLTRFMRVFEMNRGQKDSFFERIGKRYMDEAVKSADYNRQYLRLIPYIDALLEEGSVWARQQAGEMMRARRFGPEALKFFSKKIEDAVRNDASDVRQEELKRWKEVYDSATEENPFVTKLKEFGSGVASRLFKGDDAPRRTTSSGVKLNGEPVEPRRKDRKRDERDMKVGK